MATQGKAIKSGKKLKKESKKSIEHHDPKYALTQDEEKYLEINSQLVQKILAPLKQLNAIIESQIEVLENSKSKRELIRSLVSVKNGTPHILYCDNSHRQVDICRCEYLCPSRCKKYSNRRFLCNYFGCDSEIKNECQEKDLKCQAFHVFSYFPQKYAQAYYPLYALRFTELNLARNEIPKEKLKKKRIAVK
jgi:hypothetical protein